MHLVFACPFASEMQSSLLHRNGIAKQPGKVQELHWLASYRKREGNDPVCVQAIACCLYLLHLVENKC